MKHKDKIILNVLNEYNKNKELKIIDIGAGNSPLKNKIPKNMEYFSLDIDPKHKPDILCDLNKKFPIKDKEYDIVICTEVLEHTLYPKRIIKEIKRITKDDGLFILTLPNEYNLYLRFKFLFGVQNNDAIPFREELWKNHIHRGRIKDLLDFYHENFKVKKIIYSWDSFSGNKFYLIMDKFIRNLFLPISENLFARSAIMIGNKK